MIRPLFKIVSIAEVLKDGFLFVFESIRSAFVGFTSTITSGVGEVKQFIGDLIGSNDLAQSGIKDQLGAFSASDKTLSDMADRAKLIRENLSNIVSDSEGKTL